MVGPDLAWSSLIGCSTRGRKIEWKFAPRLRLKRAKQMNKKHIKETIEKLIAAERAIMRLAGWLDFHDDGVEPAEWLETAERARLNSRTRIRLLHSFAAEFEENPGHPTPSIDPSKVEWILGSLKGGDCECRKSQIVGDLVIAMGYAALQYSLLLSNRISTHGIIDDELLALAQDGFDSSAEGFSCLKGIPPMLLALELNPGVDDTRLKILSTRVHQAWAPPED